MEITLGVVIGVVILLAATRISADVVMMGGLTVLLVVGVITPEQAFIGFANPGLATVAVLYVVVAGMRETGAVNWFAASFLGQPRGLISAYLRMLIPVAILSAFVNNTPIVAMMIPVIRDWSRRTGLASAKLLMPLSYAAIVGGSCTIIGSSTNLVLNGLMIQRTGTGLGFFDIAWIGIPCALATFVYLLVLAPRLLPDRAEAAIDAESIKQYLVEMIVEEDSSLAGKSIEGAGLRHLPGLYLIDIERAGTVIPAVSPDEKLLHGDRLIFAGMVESVADLQRFDGLRVATDHVFKLESQRSNHALVEVVVSEACPLVGKTIRDGNFRNVYNAAIISVARNGEHLRGRIGDIVLHAGDMLLMEAHVDFARQHRNSKDFMLVSGVEDSQPLRKEKRTLACAVFAAMVLLASFEILPIVVAGLLAAGTMIAAGCTSASGARREISWQVLIVIGASIGIGNALQVSGSAAIIADLLVALAGDNPVLVLTTIFMVTAILTSIVSNIAAATLMFPVALGFGTAVGIPETTVLVTLMVAASASFATPIGYQTNLMVAGPGGYRFRDFVVMGVPLTLVVCVITVVCALSFYS